MRIKADLNNIQKAMEVAKKDYPTLGFWEPGFAYQNGWWIRVRLRVGTGRDKGARLSATGRRLVSASWDCHYLFMKHLFALEPTAIISTMLATYKGKADFENKYLATGLAQVGSIANPKRFAEL